MDWMVWLTGFIIGGVFGTLLMSMFCITAIRKEEKSEKKNKA